MSTLKSTERMEATEMVGGSGAAGRSEAARGPERGGCADGGHGDVDARRCYRIIAARDARYDGRFVTAVRTTGVYCRPICPSRTPKASNVTFFACAAAAEQAGFRPCRRCRPDAAPGTPVWLGSSTTVARALRLIDDGALDAETGECDGAAVGSGARAAAGRAAPSRGRARSGGGPHTVGALAERLGMSERQLRRLFAEHLGASPGAVARTRRLHFARQLIDATGLTMAEVAMQAGFRSVRQFNHAVRATFGRTPSELRARRAGGTVHGGRTEERGAGPALTLALPYRPPYDWTAVVDYLAPRAIPGVEQVGPEGYARTVRLDGRVGILRVTPAPDSEAVPRGARSVERVAPAGHHLVLELDVDLPATRRLAEVVRRVRRLFDLDADPLTVAEHLGGDPCLRPVIERRPGLRVPGAWDPFELAVRAVLGQQVSVRGATTLAGRLVRAFGTPLGDGDTPRAAGQAGGTDRLTHLFPVPAVLARAPESALAAIGLTGARAACVRALSRAVASDGGAAPSPGAPGSTAGWFDGAAGLEQVVARLTALPGIGPWTAHYIALRALREPDALPAGDLGLRRALAACRGEARPVAPRTLERAAESWSPWRGYAAMHLWASL